MALLVLDFQSPVSFRLAEEEERLRLGPINVTADCVSPILSVASVCCVSLGLAARPERSVSMGFKYMRRFLRLTVMSDFLVVCAWEIMSELCESCNLNLPFKKLLDYQQSIFITGRTIQGGPDCTPCHVISWKWGVIIKEKPVLVRATSVF